MPRFLKAAAARDPRATPLSLQGDARGLTLAQTPWDLGTFEAVWRTSPPPPRLASRKRRRRLRR